MKNDNIFKAYEENGNLYLYTSDMGTALFKPLPYDKCRIAEKICNAYPSLAPIIEDNIWDECVVEHSFPSGLADLDAGIPSTVVRLIIHVSRPRNVDDIERDLQQSRNELTDIRDKIVMKICEAFPAYTPEDVEGMDWPTQMKRLAQAEHVLGTSFSINAPGKQSASATANAGVKTRVGDDGKQYIDFDAENSVMASS